MVKKLTITMVPKVWGWEEIYHNDKYCMKRLCLDKGSRCSVHKHIKKSEGFYILEGRILLEYGTNPQHLQKRVLQPYDFVHMPAGTWHRFTGLIYSKFIESSTPDSPKDSIRKTQSEHVSRKEFAKILQRWLK